MDPRINPFTPGAGEDPPELAGRDAIREQADIATARLRRGLSTRGMLLIGLRGVGKTVLQKRILDDAHAAGGHVLKIEAIQKQSLPGLLLPPLREVLLRLSRIESARDLAARAMRGLAGMLARVKLRYADVEVVVDVEPEPGLADSGDLGYDLRSLLEAVGEAARAGNTTVLIGIDEMQYLSPDDLGLLILALHHLAQRRLPVMLLGAGLPQLPGQLGKARSYAERMLKFEEIGPLDTDAAAEAIRKPLADLKVEIDPAALDALFEQTRGYPYFLQEWGLHTWDAADASPIELDDVHAATITATAALDASFFRVRYDQLTPTEKAYLRSMAELGTGPHRSGDVAAVMERSVQSVAPLRAGLIRKGMIWSPRQGDTAFTVPLFDGYLCRVMPELPPV